MFFLISIILSWFDKTFALESFLALSDNSQTEAEKGGCLRFPRQTVSVTFRYISVQEGEKGRGRMWPACFCICKKLSLGTL